MPNPNVPASAGGITDEEARIAFPASDQSSTEPAKLVKEVRWLTDKKRVEKYPLEWPFEVDGLEYHAIVIRRMGFDEISAFMEKLRTSDGTQRFPLYADERGNLISDEIWEVIDADDRFKLVEIGRDFLPAVFRAPISEVGSAESPEA